MNQLDTGTGGTPTVKQQEATRLLNRASDGEIAAAADLLPMVYEELRALAEHFFRNERHGHTLQPTALVHEAYMRLVDQNSIEWKSRNQFFVIAAKAMRNILVDHARTKGRDKRGGGWQRVTLDAVCETMSLGGAADDGVDMERLNTALRELAELDERKARLVELRFFAGLNEQDAADVLGIARSTASEHWRMARAWLHRRLKDGAP
ncbi:MAG: sigma-70 family RNA polymerase sigma factor [Phycisphaerales bacterium]|nr:MAG: sigma-70 family RNA polymerase sigma factor [Phycisphaerales bacterium]